MKGLKYTVKKMNLPLTFLHIDEKDNVTVKSINEPINIFYELYGHEPLSYLYASQSTLFVIDRWRKNAYRTSQATLSNKEKIARIKKSEPKTQFYINATPNPENRFFVQPQNFFVMPIPSQFTNDKQLYIAWKNIRKTNKEKHNSNYGGNISNNIKSPSKLSYVISSCLNHSLFTTSKPNFFSYEGNAIIFSTFEPPLFKLKMPVYIDGMRKKDTPLVHIDIGLFEKMYQNCFLYFQKQKLEKQRKKENRENAIQNVLQLLQREDIKHLEKEYQQMIKKHLISRCDNPAIFESVIQNVLKLKTKDEAFLQWRITNNIPLKPSYLLC